MFIIFLGIFPALTLGFCCWYCCRDRHQRRQLWAKIIGGPKLSLPYVFISNVANKIISLLRRPPRMAQISETGKSVTTDTVLSVKRCYQNPKCEKDRFQNADDPTHVGAKPKQQKGREIRLEVITVQSSPKIKLKSYGVASDRLITEHVDISPLSSPEVRSASPSPKLFRKAKDHSVAKQSTNDFRNWLKDNVRLKLPSFKKDYEQSGVDRTHDSIQPQSNSSTPQLYLTSVDTCTSVPLDSQSSCVCPATSKNSPSPVRSRPSLPPPPLDKLNIK